MGMEFGVISSLTVCFVYRNWWPCAPLSGESVQKVTSNNLESYKLKFRYENVGHRNIDKYVQPLLILIWRAAPVHQYLYTCRPTSYFCRYTTLTDRYRPTMYSIWMCMHLCIYCLRDIKSTVSMVWRKVFAIIVCYIHVVTNLRL